MATFPALEGADIQADVLVGIAQAHEWLVFFRYEDAGALRAALARIRGCVTSARAHLDRRAARQAPGDCCNVALSYAGLRKLRADAEQFRVRAPFRPPAGTNLFGGYRPAPANAFAQDCAVRSHLLGDPVHDLGHPGHPRQWVVGGALAHTLVDGVLLLSAATPEAVAELARARLTDLEGATIVRIERGAALPEDREHFGYVDGIAQPSIAATLDGRDELWQPSDRQRWCEPGEFLVGHPRPSSLAPVPAPEWAHNGSFLVFRRLRQDVGGFHRWVHDVAAARQVEPEYVAALVCGRWPDGAPLLPGPDAAAGGTTARDDFDFSSDPEGAVCPLGAHVRKCNPRTASARPVPELGLDHPAPELPPRIIRRGIPYGERSRSSWHRPVHDLVDRGLLFICYQARIEEQFELITRGWMNNRDFPTERAGHDLLVGQRSGRDGERSRVMGPADDALVADRDFVVPTGGGYFFCPSLSALALLARGEP